MIPWVVQVGKEPEDKTTSDSSDLIFIVGKHKVSVFDLSSKSKLILSFWVHCFRHVKL